MSLDKLKQFLLSNAKSCVHEPKGKLKHRFVTPTFGKAPGADDEADLPERSAIGHYLQMYDWDACFFGQASHRLGLPDLPVQIAQNFIDLAEKDGHIPRTVSPGRLWDKGDMCKPFLCQLLAHQQKAGSKVAVTAGFLAALKAYLEFFERNRRHDSGLYHWRNVLESGVDNNYALLSPLEAAKDENFDVGLFPDGRLLAVDLSTYLAAEWASLSKLAQAGGDTHLAAQCQDKSALIAEAIEEFLWDEGQGFYCNLDAEKATKVYIRAWTGLTPVMLGIARADRAQRVIDDNILCEEHFLRPAGLASVAASEPLCNQAARGLYGRVVVSNWQGPTWVLPNVMAARGLVAYGRADGAVKIARRMTSTLIQDIETTGTLHENYDSETKKPLWAPHFMSWNILALELVELAG